MGDAGSFSYGHEFPNDSGDPHNAVAFVCRQLIAKIQTMTLVKVVKVTGGGLEPAGTVDVQPLVSQIDGNGYGTPHGIVSGLPWSRVQGGKNAIICDPVVDDLGYIVAASRDTSKVRATKAAALPGTRRQHDFADSVYAGGCLNVAPDQYLIFNGDGVRLVSKNGSLAFTTDGFNLSDTAGNSVVSTSSGMTLTIVGGNHIIMASGFVNIVAPALQVNGVPVTVP